MQVAQLSGYVSEQSAYHHGEASLQSTIVGMAQNFVGSNNINYLVPSGVHCPTTLTPLAGPELNVVESALDFGEVVSIVVSIGTYVHLGSLVLAAHASSCASSCAQARYVFRRGQAKCACAARYLLHT